MKTLVYLVAVVALASAQYNSFGQGTNMASQGAGVRRPTTGMMGPTVGVESQTAGVGGPTPPGPYQPVNYGPKVYGPGALNRFAFPPNPMSISRALSFVNRIPGAMVRLGMNGDVEITDRFGQEIEEYRYGPFGQEIELDF